MYKQYLQQIDSNNMVLEFYYDIRSQPCRAVYLFLKGAGVDFEPKVMDLFKGEHRSEEFLKKNPYHKVPIIDDNGFVLAESVAIMRYIANKYDLPEHWYPRADVVKQARVDEFLNWQHWCIRKPVVDLFLTLFKTRLAIGPFPKTPADPKKVEEAKTEISRAVTHIADYFLQDRQYIAGDEISAADILGLCELQQLEGVDQQTEYENNPKVKAWVRRVETRLQPHYEVVKEQGVGVLGKMWRGAKE